MGTVKCFSETPNDIKNLKQGCTEGDIAESKPKDRFVHVNKLYKSLDLREAWLAEDKSLWW